MVQGTTRQADAERAWRVAKKESLGASPRARRATSLEERRRTSATAIAPTIAEPVAGFDKSYVDTQVKEHQAVLDMIDQKLLAERAQDPEVRIVSHRGPWKKVATCTSSTPRIFQSKMQK